MFSLFRLLSLFIWILVISPNLMLSQSASPIITVDNVDLVGEVAIFGRGGLIDLVYSPDDTLLAVASKRGTWLYDSTNLKYEPHLLEGNVDLTSSVAFSPDGKIIASGSYDNTIWLWDAQTKQQIARLTGHQKAVTKIAFSPDGTLLASGSLDNTIRLWDVEQHNALMILEDHTTGVRSIAFSPDGETIASASMDRTIKLWNMSTQKLIVWNTTDASVVNDLAFSPDGGFLVAGYRGHAGDGIALWNIHSGQQIGLWDDNRFNSSRLTFSPDGRLLAYGSRDGTVKVRHVQEPAILMNLLGSEGAISSVAFSHDGRLLASTSMDGTVRIWDIQTQRQTDQSESNASWINHVAFSSDMSTLYGVEIYGSVQIWDIQTQRPIDLFKMSSEFPLYSAFSATHMILALGYQDRLDLWDVSNRTLITRLEREPIRLDIFGFSPNNSMVAWGAAYTTIVVWDIQSKQQITEITLSDSANAITFSPDGSLLAIGLVTGELVIWDVIANHAVEQIAGHPSTITNIQFSPDHTKLITTAGSNLDATIVQLWDIETRMLLTETTIQNDHLRSRCVAFAPDGSLLALCSYATNDILILNANNLELLAQLNYHTDALYDVTFSQDGRFLVSGSLDGTIRLYVVP